MFHNNTGIQARCSMTTSKMIANITTTATFDQEILIAEVFDDEEADVAEVIGIAIATTKEIHMIIETRIFNQSLGSRTRPDHNKKWTQVTKQHHKRDLLKFLLTTRHHLPLIDNYR